MGYCYSHGTLNHMMGEECENFFRTNGMLRRLCGM